MAWSLEHVRSCLRTGADQERVREGVAAEPPQAAVAIVLRFAPSLDVLLIRRSEHDGDPWSGHMAFPGGRRDPSDESTLATALRETLEEVGWDLRHDAEHLGALAPLPAVARGHALDLEIVPHVFVAHRTSELVLSDEVVEALWTPVEPLVDGQVDTVRPYRYEGYDLELPAYQVGEHVVWGLTYRMLGMLFERLGAMRPQPVAAMSLLAALRAKRG